MSKDGKQFTKDGASVPNLQRLSGIVEKDNSTVKHLQGGATVPTLQKVEAAPEKKGATVPTMQPVMPPAQTDRQSQDTQTTGDAGKK